MNNLDLKYTFLVNSMVDSILIQESFIQSIKDFFIGTFDRIRNFVGSVVKKISGADLGEEGSFIISIPIPERIEEVQMTQRKVSSASVLKGKLFEIETILALQKIDKRIKSKTKQSDSKQVRDQLKTSIGNKAGKVIREVERASRVSVKLILNPIKEAGGTITEINSTRLLGQQTGGIEKLDLEVRWKKIGLSKEQLDKVSLKLYSNKSVTIANKSIDTFFTDFFSPKHAKEVNVLIDKDKKLKDMQKKEGALNLKVKQMTKKFKKSKKVEDINEQRKQIRAEIHPRIMKIVFGYIQKLLDNLNTRKMFITSFFEYSGMDDKESRIVFVLNTSKGRMQGMIDQPDINLSKMKLAYSGGSTFQIKNSTNNKTMIQFGVKVGGQKLNIDVPFTSAKFRRF